jgi:hypothetical protein
MTTIMALNARIASLEAGMSDLRAENELLKMQLPLEALTAGLKAASPEEIAAFLAAAELPAKKAKKAAKTAEEKEKKTTNPKGPSEWNVFVNATWHEMAAEKGVVSEVHDAAFKKASAAVGVTYQVAMKEASRRKAELEGKEPKAKKAASPKAESPEASAASSPAAESPAASAPASPKAESPVPKTLPAPTKEQIKAASLEYDDVMRDSVIRECVEDWGYQAVLAGGQACWLDPATGKVHCWDTSNVVGNWDAKKGVFTSV